MLTPGSRPSRRRPVLALWLGAASLAALVPFASAQFGSTGDLRVVVTGGEYEGEYALTGVELFFCGFGVPEAGHFSLQYYSDDMSAWPSVVQAGHRQPDAPEVETPDFVILFGDPDADGGGYVIWEAQGQGTLETAVEDLGDSAGFTLEGTTVEGVGIRLEAACQAPQRFEGGGD